MELVKEFLNKSISELNIVFAPFKLSKINIERMMAFEVKKDDDGGLLFHTSDNIQDLLGYSIDDFYFNLTLKDILEPNIFLTFMKKLLFKIENNDDKFTFEIKVKNVKGEYLWVYINLGIDFADDKNWQSISGYMIDISEFKFNNENKIEKIYNNVDNYINTKIENELTKKDLIPQYQLTHTTATESLEQIAHQWRQPLNVISLLLQDLYFKFQLGTIFPPDASIDEVKKIVQDTFEENYKKINDRVQYLSDIIDDFRNHFMHNEILEPEFFNLYNFFQDIEEFILPSLKVKNIKFFNKIPENNMKVYGIKSYLRQTVLTIINNAEVILQERKINNPTIKVYSEIKNNMLNIVISDNAGGIPEDILTNIFEPYFTTRKEKNGSGLGLYIARTFIIEGFKGDIFAMNNQHCENKDTCPFQDGEPCKKGACFIIQLAFFKCDD
jgi:signal transduction histidine kinase